MTQSDELWHRLLQLAHDRNTEITRLIDNGDQTIWSATSFSRPGLLHVVDVDANPNGVRFDCSCEAGRDGNKPCHHAAAVLAHIGFISLPDPEPTPEPSPELTRLKGQRSIAMLNGDCDEEDRLIDKIIALESGR